MRDEFLAELFAQRGGFLRGVEVVPFLGVGLQRVELACAHVGGRDAASRDFFPWKRQDQLVRLGAPHERDVGGVVVEFGEAGLAGRLT